MKALGFCMGITVIFMSIVIGAEFLMHMYERSHLKLHHDGVLLLAVCGVALGTILMVLSEDKG